MKLLSVIIPLYNSAAWLEKCLLSILNQDIPEEQLEIICINDGSPDNSADIARGLAQQHPCILVLDQNNQGPSGARNTGMRHATGEYLSFVDPDDYVEPHSYGELIAVMHKNGLDMLRFGYFVEDENNCPTKESKHPIPFDYSEATMSGSEFIANRLGIQCYIWAYIYRRSIITENNIWCYIGDYYDDTPWLPQVLMKAERVGVINKKVVHYIIHSGSLVRANSPKMIERKLAGCKFLQQVLREQLKGVSDRGVGEWYNMMLSHCSYNMLTISVLNKPEQCPQIIEYLKGLHAFPLSLRGTAYNTKIKYLIVNVSPQLFVRLLRIKSR